MNVSSSVHHTGEDNQPSAQIPQPESNHEVTRLLLQEQLCRETLNKPQPAHCDLVGMKQALDVRCGIGSWTHEMAMRYPEMHITAVDGSATCIAYAQERMSGVPNVTLQVQDIYALTRQTFDGREFDVMHLHFLAHEVSCHQFPAFIQSLEQLTYPGGLLLWTETELPMTSSPACDYIASMLLVALQAAGRAFSPGFTLSLGICNRMRSWLQQAGYAILSDTVSFLEISQGEKTYEAFYQQALIYREQLQSFLLETGVVTKSVFEEAFEQLQQEFQEKTFCGLCPLHTLVAVKRGNR